MIDTATWDDPWFADLDVDAKLTFLYLLTNRRSTAAGAFEITLRAMAFETGIKQERIEKILATLQGRVYWWPEHSVVWIRNFFKHQAANENFAKSAQKAVADLPAEVQRAISLVYPSLVTHAPPPDEPTGMDTHPNGYATGIDTPDAVIDIDIEIDTDTEKSSNSSESFDAFWSVYPRREAKGDALKAWTKLAPDADLLRVIGDALRNQLANNWKGRDKQYIPLPATWIRNQRWEDDIIPYKNGDAPSLKLFKNNGSLTPAGILAGESRREGNG